MIGAAGPGIRTLFRGVKTPLSPNLGCCFILSSVLHHTLDLRLEPRIEHRDSELLKKFADTVAPAEPLLSFSRRNEIHRTRKIYARVPQQIRFFHSSH